MASEYLRAEVEDVPNLDATGNEELGFGNGAGVGIVLVVRRRIERRPGLEDRFEIAFVIDGLAARIHVEQAPVGKHLGFACRRENHEFMRKITADRTGFGQHGDRLQPHARIGPQVGDEHGVVGALGGFEIQIEGIGVLHEELAPPHDAKPRPDLVAEFPLDMVEILRQIPVTANIVAHDLGDLFFVGRAVEHVAAVAVLEAQHLRSVRIVAPAFAPEIGELHGGHENSLRAGVLHFLVNDVLDPAKDPEAERQPGIDAGACLADHAGAQHQPVRDDLRFRRRFLERR